MFRRRRGIYLVNGTRVEHNDKYWEIRMYVHIHSTVSTQRPLFSRSKRKSPRDQSPFCSPGSKYFTLYCNSFTSANFLLWVYNYRIYGAVIPSTGFIQHLRRKEFKSIQPHISSSVVPRFVRKNDLISTCYPTHGPLSKCKDANEILSLVLSQPLFV